MKKGLVISGIVLLIVGLLLMILLWPLVAVPPLYYPGPYDGPDKAKKGETYKYTGSVYDAVTKGEYTAMIVDFDNGESLPIVEKGIFNKGDRVVMVVTVKTEPESTSGEKKKATMSESEKKTFIDNVKQMDESVLEMFYSAYSNEDIDISVNHTPEAGGIGGIVLFILGIVLMILGFALGREIPEEEEEPLQMVPPYGMAWQQPPTMGYSQPQQMAPQQPYGAVCPTCGRPATYVAEYERWYCYNCQRYL